MPGDEPEQKPEEKVEEAVADAAQRPEDTPGAEPAQDSTEEGAGVEQEVESELDAGAQLAELWKEDPELARSVAEHLPQEVKDSFRGPELAVAETERGSRLREHQTDAQEIESRAGRADQVRQQATDTWLEELETNVGRGVDDLVEGRATNKAVLGERAKLSEKVTEFTLQAQQGLHERMLDAFGLQLRVALEDHGTQAHLTSDQRQKIKELGKSPEGNDQYNWIKAIVTVYLDAAQASDAETETRIRKEVESGTENTERLAKAVAVLNGAGRKKKPLTPGGAPGGGGKTYVDMTAEERAKLTPEQRDQMIAADRARQEAVAV